MTIMQNTPSDARVNFYLVLGMLAPAWSQTTVRNHVGAIMVYIKFVDAAPVSYPLEDVEVMASSVALFRMTLTN